MRASKCGEKILGIHLCDIYVIINCYLVPENWISQDIGYKSKCQFDQTILTTRCFKSLFYYRIINLQNSIIALLWNCWYLCSIIENIDGKCKMVVKGNASAKWFSTKLVMTPPWRSQQFYKLLLKIIISFEPIVITRENEKGCILLFLMPSED